MSRFSSFLAKAMRPELQFSLEIYQVLSYDSLGLFLLQSQAPLVQCWR